MESKAVILTASKDWDLWLSIIRRTAEGLTIWDKVNPELATKQLSLPKPEKPVFVDSDNADTFNINIKRFEIQEKEYKYNIAEYKQEQQAFAKLLELISSTISATNAIYIQRTEAHPWAILRTLKERLAPSDNARLLEIEVKYRSLCKGPKNQDIDKWLDEWVQTYTQAVQLKIGEVTGTRPVRDFLLAVSQKDPQFASFYTIRQQEGEDIDLHKIIEIFRSSQRLQSIHNPSQSKSQHSTFATNSQSDSRSLSSSRHTRFRGNIPVPKCICSSQHYYSDCEYLNPAARPSNWKANPQVQSLVDAALKDTALKQKIDEKLAAAKKHKKHSSPSPSTSKPAELPANNGTNNGIFAVTCSSFAGDSAQKFALRTSWILDSGSDIHVCNSSMKQRFTKTHSAHPSDIILAGAQQLQIKCYGTIRITTKSESGTATMDLINVAYVPSFFTNLVAYTKLESKGVFIDGRNRRLERDGNTFCLLSKFGGHSLMEDNTASIAQADSSQQAYAVDLTKPSSARTASEWHSILGHASADAIEHLASSTEGVEITRNGTPVPKTHECEPCALSKAHNIVSRSPLKSEPSTRPFQRITFDLIQFDTGYNGHQWASHVACDYTDLNMVWTHARKTDAPQILLDALALIETRYGQKVVYIRTDGEKALNTEFKAELSAKGVTFEPSSPDTPAQNGHSERKGGILTTKARTLRLAARLPTSLWPEFIRVAGYITNRTPTKKHQWKTPAELVTGLVPNLAHLKTIGCKAYVLNKHVPRKKKLAERAHIGHLVGYDSTNIFRIWIPSKQKVVSTRDVTFDESSFYDASEPDLLQLIEEPMLNTTLDLPNLARTSQLFDVESDSDSDIDISSRIPTDNVEVQIPVFKTPGGARRVYLPSPDPSDAGDSLQLPSNTQSGTYRPGPTSSHQHSDSGTRPSTQGSILGSHQPVGNQPTTQGSTSGSQQQHPATKSRPHENNSAPRAKEISPSFDTSNILPEGVGRKRIHKAALAVQQEQACQSLALYHSAFSAFSTARSLYEYEEPRGSTTVDSPTTVDSSAPQSPTIATQNSFHRDSLPLEPDNYAEATRHPHAEGFKQAIATELSTLQAKQTWELVDPQHATTAGKTPIPTRWVFKYKFDTKGYLVKYKARLCARGDLQYTEQDTFAATLAARIFRALMAIVAAFDLETRQYDAVNAFVNSPIDEPTYCKPPGGWNGPPNVLLLLQRALYGLKQSPALWYRHFSTTLLRLGLEPVLEVDCLFKNKFMLVFFFVDDIVVLYDKQHAAQINDFQQQLFETYEMRFLGPLQWFIGIHVTRDRNTRRLWLSQHSYIDKLTAKFKLNLDGRHVQTPLPVEEFRKFTSEATPAQIYGYQQRVGSLNFAAVITRPDIAYAVSILSSFLTNPSSRHIELADRVLRYLAFSKHLAIEFNPQTTDPHRVFISSSDASYGDDPDTRRSTQGSAYTLFNGIINWKACRQKTVTTSTTEAELLGVSDAAKETLWWSRFFLAIDFELGHQLAIQCDNEQTIRALTSTNPRFHTKLRHIDIHHFWLRQELQRHTISIRWTPSAEILADGFTKPLPGQRHKDFVGVIGLVNHMLVDQSVFRDTTIP